MIVLLERGAATRGVGDDGVELAAAKRGDVLAGQLAGRFAHTGMRGKCAAAELRAGDDDFAAVGREDANGRFIELGEGDIGDASGKEGHARAAGALRGKGLAEFAEKEMIVDAGQETLAIGEAEQFEDAGGAGERLQAGALVEAKQSGGEGDTVGVGKQALKNDVARESREERALVLVFNARAGVFDEFAVFHAGGAGGFAGAAIEAFINVADETFGERQFAVAHQNHLADAAAGRIAFEMPEAIGRTVVQAQAAMDAARKILVNRNRAGNGLRRPHCSDSSHKTAGRENILRIERVLHALHHAEIGAVRAPDVHA